MQRGGVIPNDEYTHPIASLLHEYAVLTLIDRQHAGTFPIEVSEQCLHEGADFAVGGDGADQSTVCLLI